MMPTILLRLVIVCNVLNSILAYFFPKKLRSFLTSYSFSSSSSSRSEPAASASSAAAAAAQQGDLTRTLVADPIPSHNHGPSDLDRVFRMFDRNGDGKITRAELTDSLEDLGIFIPERDLAAFIARVDADGDGCVDSREFVALYKDLMAKKPGAGDQDQVEEEEDMRDVFCVFDENGDGYITVEELQSVLDTLGVRQGRSVEDCRTMIRNVDVDGDGRVDYEEFKRMMRQGRVCAVAT